MIPSCLHAPDSCMTAERKLLPYEVETPLKLSNLLPCGRNLNSDFAFIFFLGKLLGDHEGFCCGMETLANVNGQTPSLACPTTTLVEPKIKADCIRPC